jgi:hypothetical protein
MNNSVSFELIEGKAWAVRDNKGDIGTISYGTEYTYQPNLYHQYSADSLLIISRYLNKLNKQGLDILR